jgi:hypothetical protein
MNQLLKAFSKERMIIHDHNAFRVRQIALRISVGRSGAFHFNGRDAALRCPVGAARRSSLHALRFDLSFQFPLFNRPS